MQQLKHVYTVVAGGGIAGLCRDYKQPDRQSSERNPLSNLVVNQLHNEVFYTVARESPVFKIHNYPGW